MPYSTPEKKHYTVTEQKNRLPLYLQEFYVLRQLDRIKIDRNEIQGYFEYSFIEEKSYITSPERSAGGTLDNLNSYPTFFTPRLSIKYNYMHISDYRKLMTLLNSKNEFVIECYDIVKDKIVRHKMYHATAQMPTIHQRYLEVLGVRDYTVELIGTNVGFETVEIRYHDKDGVLIAEATQTVDKGTEAIIDYNYVAPTGYRFDGKWNDIKNNVIRYNTNAIFVTEDIDLYASVDPDSQFTLSFNYGNGNTLYSQTAGAINNITITSGATINNAILSANITLDNGSKFTFPEAGTGGLSVLHKGEYVVPYEFKGWYWTPVANQDTLVSGNSIFSYSVNRTIYQIYEPKSYEVTYNTNFNGAITYEPIMISYGARVPLPALRLTGFTFIGWYLDSNLTQSFNGVMPPEDITLYAKWEKND